MNCRRFLEMIGQEVYNGSNGGGWKLMNGDVSIFYHPGGGKHGGSYYGISSGATGKIKVVNPETYIPLKGDRATIIYD